MTPKLLFAGMRKFRSWLIGIATVGIVILLLFSITHRGKIPSVPIPSINGDVSFHTENTPLTANSTYERDGKIIHYIDEPTTLEKIWMTDNHHILVGVTNKFGIEGSIHPYDLLFGRDHFSSCEGNSNRVNDFWFYVYKADRSESTTGFEKSRFGISPCAAWKNMFPNYPSKLENMIQIKEGDLLYIALSPEEHEKFAARSEEPKIIFTGTSPPPPPVCNHDGQLDVEEECDDGNIMSGDGCNATCSIEEGWTCDGTPMTCTQEISECLDGIDNDHDGHTDALGYKLLASVNFKMDFPMTTYLPSIVHPIVAKYNKYVVAFSSARPSLSVLNIATGALEESLRPLFPTANDDVVDMSGRNYAVMEFQKKVQNGDFVADVCDPSEATKVHAVAVYESNGYFLIRVNTGECVALALSSYSGVPWVIETVNGSAISNIVINSYGGANVQNPNLHDRILYLGAPGLPPRIEQYDNANAVLNVASTMLSAPKGTKQQMYAAPMALLIGNADENFNQEFPPLQGLQQWTFGEKIAVGDTVFASYAGRHIHETCTGTKCSRLPETDVEGYLVRLDPSQNPIAIRTAKLPAGMSHLKNLTYDKQTNQIFGVMYAHEQMYSIVAFDASTMELMGQAVIDPSIIHFEYGADGSSLSSTPLFISHMAVSDNNLLVFANKGKQTYDLFVYSYSINNLTPNGQKKFVFTKDIGNESAKGGYIGWIPGYALIDNNTLWTTVRTLDPSTLQPIQSYLLRIDPQTLSITKEINIPNGAYSAEFGKDVRKIVLNGNWKSNIIDYSTQNPVVTEVPGIVAYTDFLRGILVVMQKDKTYKSVNITTGEITNVQNPLLTTHDAFYPVLFSDDGYTTYRALNGQQNRSLATHRMCNP